MIHTTPRPAILVIDSDRARADLLRRILAYEGYDVYTARTGEEGYTLATQRAPGVVLVNADLPGMDGYRLCRLLRQNPVTRSLPIVMLGADDDLGGKLAGFEAGADDYLARPFALEELLYRIKSLLARTPSPALLAIPESSRGKIIAVFGTKGGVGKTTIAANLSIALQQRTREPVLLFDSDFFFGDVDAHLDLSPKTGVIDLIAHMSDLEPALIDQVVLPHSSGIRVLLGPFRAEEGETITADHVARLLEVLPALYKHVVVDCPTSYDERILVTLERADDILLVVTPEIGALKNASRFLDLAAALELPLDKIHLILNRANSNVGIEASELERTLQQGIAFRLVSGGRAVVRSVNRGVPLLVEQPNHPFAQQIVSIADALKKRESESPDRTNNRVKSLS